jgi:hypothetical protein
MKILMILILLFSSASLGLTVTTSDGTSCDFSTIKSNADGTYTYSATQNSCVGKIIQDGATKDKQMADLYKAITQFKLTIATDEQRIQALMVSLSEVSARVEKSDNLQKSNDKLAFGLGVLTTLVAAETMAKLSGH